MGLLARSVLALLLCMPPWSQAPDAKEAEAWITLERTRCFGECPAYKVSVDRAGNVRYDGTLHVAQSGHREWRVNPARVEHLLKLLGRVNFLDMKSDCKRGIYDAPSTAITLHAGGREATLGNCWAGGPIEFGILGENLDPDLDVHALLDWLASWIDLALDTAPYVKGEKPR